jgi:uncharacterized membrane protein
MSNKLPRKRPGNTPQQQKEERSSSLGLAAIQNHFSGPIPPPEMLARYDEILPGAAKTILQRAETESTHRCEMEKNILSEQVAADKRTASEVRLGQILGFVSVIAIVSLSAYATHLGKDALAIGLGVSTIAGLVTAFIKGRK